MLLLLPQFISEQEADLTVDQFCESDLCSVQAALCSACMLVSTFHAAA